MPRTNTKKIARKHFTDKILYTQREIEIYIRDQFESLCSDLEIMDNVPEDAWKLINDAEESAVQKIETMNCADATEVSKYLSIKDDDFIQDAIENHINSDLDDKANDLVYEGYIVIKPESLFDKCKIEDFVTSEVYPFYNQHSTILNNSFF